jgi:hypothetical protein
MPHHSDVAPRPFLELHQAVRSVLAFGLFVGAFRDGEYEEIANNTVEGISSDQLDRLAQIARSAHDGPMAILLESAAHLKRISLPRASNS